MISKDITRYLTDIGGRAESEVKVLDFLARLIISILHLPQGRIYERCRRPCCGDIIPRSERMLDLIFGNI